MQQSMRIRKLDEWKWAAALLVVAIHTSPLESINVLADFILTRELARIAVPLFFMITGFFTFKQGRILSSLKKLMILYAGVTLLYLPVQIYRYIPIKQAEFGTILRSVIRAVFFDGTYYHLWYLPAVIEGLVIVYLLLKLGRKAAFILSLLLYIIGLMGDSYYGLISQIPVCKKIFEWMFLIFSQTRNGIFFAPLFLLMGYEISFIHIKRKERAFKYYIVWLVMMVAEGVILHFAGWQRHDSMYLCLPFCMFFLFLFLTSGEKQATEGLVASVMKDGPMLLYFIHPYIIILARGFVKVTGWTFLLTISPLYYVCVLLGSVAAVMGYLYLHQRLKSRKGENHVSEG